MKLQSHRVVLLASLAAVMCLASLPAHAQVEDIEVKEIEVSKTIELTLDKPLFLRFQSPILSTIKPKDWKVIVTEETGSDVIQLYAREDLSSDDIPGTLTVMTREYTLYGHVQAAKSGTTRDAYLIKHDLTSSQLREHLEKLYEQKLQEKDKQHAAEIEALERQIEVLKAAEQKRTETIAEIEIARGLVSGRGRHRVIDQASEPGDGMSIRGVEWVESAKRHFLRFVMENRQGIAFPVATLELQDGAGDDFAGGAVIGDHIPTDKLIATLEPGEVVTGTIAVRNFKSLSGNVRLVAKGPKGVQKSFRVIPVDPPIPPELTPREKRARQTTVGVSGNVGAFWIADGLGAGQLDATDYRGIGVRLLMGYNEHWAVEVSVAGGKTGTARFPGMSIDGMDGELTRSASFGRAGFSGILRRGDKISPYLRLGAGVQGASFEAAFSEAVDMDESSFEFSVLLTLGGGVQVRLGGNWLLGVALSAETPLGGSEENYFRNALSLGGHVAYGW